MSEATPLSWFSAPALPPGACGDPLEPKSLDSTEPQFSDVAADNTHFAAVNGAAVQSLAQGNADGNFAPSVETRRDQMATFVARLFSVVRGQTVQAP